MSSASGIRAGRAFIEMGVNDSALRRGLQAASQQLKSFGKGLSIAGGAMAAGGAAILGPLAGAAFSAAKTGDELNKMANRTGASVESLSELKHAAEQSDVSFEQLGGGMKFMQKNLASGSKAFEELGLSTASLSHQSPDQQFEAIAQAISEIDDPAKRTAAAMSVFGRSGADLLPMMIDGAKGIQTLRKEARDLGLQVSTSDANAATLFGDTWANFQKVSKDVVTELGMALLPTLTSVTAAIIPIVKSVASWIADNRGLIVTIAGIGAGLVTGGTLLGGFGAALIVAGTAIGAIATIGGVLVSVLGAIVSPIGLVVIGVTAAAAAFLTMTETGRSLVKILRDGFVEALKITQETVGGMFNAIKAGDFGLAGRILWTGFKLAMSEAMNAVANAFGTNLNDMIGMLSDFFAKSQKTIAGMVAAAGILARSLPGNAGIGDALKAAAAALAKIDAGKLKIDLQSSLDPEKLKEELAALNATAATSASSGTTPAGGKSNGLSGLLKQASGGITGLVTGGAGSAAAALKSGLDWLEENKLEDAGRGLSEAADRQSSPALGTFSAAEAALFGGGSLQQKQLTAMERVVKNTDPKNQRGIRVT